MRPVLRILSILLLPLLLMGVSRAIAQTIYEAIRGSVAFHSQAPKELITASSKALTGVVDINRRTFAFRIMMASFQGFNSPLQREHFNENYLETSQIPAAAFSGKIIEDIDLTRTGEYDVRAKGKLSIHGVERERTITCHVDCRKNRIIVHSEFIVLLADHNIKIPRIVYDKLAPEIHVTVHAELEPKK